MLLPSKLSHAAAVGIVWENGVCQYLLRSFASKTTKPRALSAIHISRFRAKLIPFLLPASIAAAGTAARWSLSLSGHGSNLAAILCMHTRSGDCPARMKARLPIIV